MLFRAGGAIRVYETALADLGHATLDDGRRRVLRAPGGRSTSSAYVRALANPLDELGAVRRARLAAVRPRRRRARRSWRCAPREQRRPAWDGPRGRPTARRAQRAFAARFARGARACAARWRSPT